MEIHFIYTAYSIFARLRMLRGTHPQQDPGQDLEAEDPLLQNCTPRQVQQFRQGVASRLGRDVEGGWGGGGVGGGVEGREGKKIQS